MSNGLLDLIEKLPDSQIKSDLVLGLATLSYCLKGIDYDNPDSFRRQFLDDKGRAMMECISDAAFILERDWDYCPVGSDLFIRSPYETLRLA